MTRATTILGMLALCGALAACSQGDQDLRDWVVQARARPAPPIEPIPEISPYTPFAYDPAGRRAPFTPTTPETAASNSDLAPDPERPRDPLEAYPLDALQMVGTISRRGTAYALVRAPDNVVHRVRVGDHVGQNFGQITAVSDAGMTLDEIVPDGNGGYESRPAALAPSQ